MWLMSHTSYFKPEHMAYISEQVNRLTDEQANYLLTLNLKNPTTILLFSIFLGELGVDRFMLGDVGMGVGKLLTFGGCLVWWLIDLFLVQDRARVKNYETLMGFLNYQMSYSAPQDQYYPPQQ
jgi:TM2 domain-containing membrane protein YozV